MSASTHGSRINPARRRRTSLQFSPDRPELIHRRFPQAPVDLSARAAPLFGWFAENNNPQFHNGNGALGCQTRWPDIRSDWIAATTGPLPPQITPLPPTDRK